MSTHVRWVQIEPRRLYRATIDSHEYDLGYRGRAAAPQAGWYLLGPNGADFMGRRLHDAAEAATKEITSRATN